MNDFQYNSPQKCGDSSFWSLSKEGELRIFGKGEVYSEKTLRYEFESAWFPYKEQIKKVFVEEGITRLPETSFSECVNLESVSLPSTLESTEFGFFSDCSKLKEVNFPEGMKYFLGNCFFGCSGVRISVPASAEFISPEFLFGCSRVDLNYSGKNKEIISILSSQMKRL